MDRLEIEQRITEADDLFFEAQSAKGAKRVQLYVASATHAAVARHMAGHLNFKQRQQASAVLKRVVEAIKDDFKDGTL
jgi:hypothetical protein